MFSSHLITSPLPYSVREEYHNIGVKSNNVCEGHNQRERDSLKCWLRECDGVAGLQSVWWLFMINQPGCIVWSNLGLELKLVSLFSNNQVNSGAKTKAADLWGSRGGWTYHLFTPRHAPRAPWAPWSTLATQHDGWTFYLRSRNGLSHTSHIPGHHSQYKHKPMLVFSFNIF